MNVRFEGADAVAKARRQPPFGVGLLPEEEGDVALLEITTDEEQVTGRALDCDGHLIRESVSPNRHGAPF